MPAFFAPTLLTPAKRCYIPMIAVTMVDAIMKCCGCSLSRHVAEMMVYDAEDTMQLRGVLETAQKEKKYQNTSIHHNFYHEKFFFRDFAVQVSFPYCALHAGESEQYQKFYYPSLLIGFASEACDFRRNITPHVSCKCLAPEVQESKHRQ